MPFALATRTRRELSAVYVVVLRDGSSAGDQAAPSDMQSSCRCSSRGSARVSLQARVCANTANRDVLSVHPGMLHRSSSKCKEARDLDRRIKPDRLVLRFLFRNEKKKKNNESIQH